METNWNFGDIIEYSENLFMVLKNYGYKGRVQEYFPGGNTGTIIDNFYWQINNETCKLIQRKNEVNKIIVTDDGWDLLEE
ncbi:MAG: hypothetical protein ACOC2W_01975 [bacterium]